MLLGEKLALKTPSGELLQHLSYQLNKSQILCVMGPNGCGKSTFLKHVFNQHRFLNPKLKISYLPQTHNKDFFVPHTLQEISTLALKSKKLPTLFEAYLPQKISKRLWNLASGGERQRALLLQVLSAPSDIYLLDEPFNHLDSIAIEEFSKLINLLTQENGKSFVIATHVVPQTLDTRFVQNLNFIKIDKGVQQHA